MTAALNGILVTDKPAGMSSAAMVGRLKRFPGVEKIGHAGTLDPFATGVLVCCINQATKLARFLLSGPKTYRATMRLGIDTDTQDATGSILARKPVPAMSAETIAAVFKRFKGPIEQVPPVYSALKHKGVPLYKLARKGTPVQKPARQVEIYSLTIVDVRLPDVGFEVSCSAGTYIRTLCADAGRAMGCGGHLKALRRTSSSGFTLEAAVSLKELTCPGGEKRIGERLIGLADALPRVPEKAADNSLTEKIKYGRIITYGDVKPQDGRGESGYVKVVDPQRRLLAILRAVPERRVYKYCCVFHGS